MSYFGPQRFSPEDFNCSKSLSKSLPIKLKELQTLPSYVSSLSQLQPARGKSNTSVDTASKCKPGATEIQPASWRGAGGGGISGLIFKDFLSDLKN